MDQLPLFPLKTVLFPGMPLPLYIFEPRYLKMMETCIQDRKPFGVVLIKKGREALGPLAETYDIGTSANIFKVDRHQNGHLNILAVGDRRFMVHGISEEDGHLVGDVEYLEFEDEPDEALDTMSADLRPWMRKYIEMISDAKIVKTQDYAFPESPLELAFMGAFLLQISPQQKQAMLETETSLEIMEEVYSTFRREVPLMRSLIENRPKAKKGIEGRLN